MPKLMHRPSAAPSLSTPSRRLGSTSAAFGLSLAGATLIGLLQGVKPFYGDSLGYWQLAETFTHNGHFSLMNYENDLRGFVVPLFTYVLRLIAQADQASQSAVVTCSMALLFALIGAVVAPLLAEAIWPERRWGFGRRVALTALLLVFWAGNLNYPLSDFPGLAMALLALAAVARSDSPVWMLTAGVAGAAAINTRPAYVLLAPMLVGIVGLTWFRHRGSPGISWTRRGLCTGLFLAGFAAVTLPQALMLHNHYGIWRLYPGTDTEASSVLSLGMKYERLDSYEGPGGPSQILYGYGPGTQLLAAQPGAEIKSSSQYVGLFFSHPTVMATILTQHFVNGFDVRYNSIYVERLASGGRLWLRLAGFLLAFMALVRLLWGSARRGLGQARWLYVLALFLCCLPALASHTETRYMLPIYLLSYMLVLTPGWPNPIDTTKTGLMRWRTPAALSTAYLIFMVAVWHVVGDLDGVIPGLSGQS